MICWNVSLGTPLFKGHLHSGTPNLVPEKHPHNLCIYYLYWWDTSIQEKGTLLLGPKLRFNLHSGDILALKKWLTTKRVDICKCTLITIMQAFTNWTISIYKIAKIVRALWSAERRVCMRVCKHGCDVKMFCFSRANHVSTNLKKFLTSKLDKVTLFTHSFVGWNLENLYKQAVSIFFSLKLTF